jgi:hypothetical protein
MYNENRLAEESTFISLPAEVYSSGSFYVEGFRQNSVWGDNAM